MRRFYPCLFFIAACFIFHISLRGQSTLTGIHIIDQLYLTEAALNLGDPAYPLTSFLGPMNTGIAHQDAIVSHGNYQYVVYYNKGRHLCISRRRHNTDRWEEIVFTDYVQGINDAHNKANMGICPNNGTIHIAFDHHADDLNYRHSLSDVVSDPENVVWDASLFSDIKDYLEVGQVLTKVTYPRFITTPEGELQFSYRDGTSSNGHTRFADYTAASGWQDNRIIIHKDGDFVLDGMLHTNRNAYHNYFTYDDEGTLYISWTFREKSGPGFGFSTNHDLYFAYSEDRGKTWKNNAGDVVADLETDLSMSIDTEGLLVYTIPHGTLINNGGQAVDAKGNVHVIMRHADELNTGISYYHYRRQPNGVWSQSRLNISGSRARLYVDAYDNLLLTYNSGGKIKINAASPEDDYQSWPLIISEGVNLSGDMVADLVRFKQDGILTVMLQKRPVAYEATPIEVFDLSFDYDFNCNNSNELCSDTQYLFPERDVYVRGGDFADVNFADRDYMIVKNSANPTYTRELFLRFHLEPLLHKGVIENVTLKIHVQSPSDPSPNELVAYFCPEDRWQENTITWKNKPVATEEIGRTTARSGYIEWDITQGVIDELKRGGGRITIKVVTEGIEQDSWIKFYTKEVPGAFGYPWPHLVVNTNNYIETEQDVTVIENDANNYGSSIGLAIAGPTDNAVELISYVRFDISPLETQSDIERVTLQVHGAFRSDLSRTTLYSAHHVSQDVWPELGTNWFNKPDHAIEAIDEIYGRDTMAWDVTDHVLSRINQEGRLTFALRSEANEGGRAIVFFSKDFGSLIESPKLIFHYGDGQPPELVDVPEEITTPQIENSKDVYLDWPIYPNPFTNLISISNPTGHPGEIIMYNSAAQIVEQLTLTSHENISMTTTDLNSGMYIVRILNAQGEQIGVKKLVKY